MGRTGRRRDGRVGSSCQMFIALYTVVVLVTEGEEAKTYYRSQQKGKTMYENVLDKASSSLAMFPGVSRMVHLL